MKKRNIPFGVPQIGVAERQAAQETLMGPQLVHGPKTKVFEEEFSRRIGTNFAVSLSSCTAGLHLSLFANNIGPGDKVAVPAMTHVATAHAVEFCGAEPVFIDVERDTGNIDAEILSDVAKKIDLKAIIIVHYLGLPCDMDRILPIAKTTGAVVIEDCALALGATHGGISAGGLGDSGCFSFYPVKHMTTLEGGMLTTNNEELAQSVAQSKSFGYDRSLGARTKPGIYDVVKLGYNFRMNELQAAIGIAQLTRLDGFLKARAENFDILCSELMDLEEITIFAPKKGKARSSHYCLNAILPKDGSIERDELVAYLKHNGIGTSVHYPSAVPLFSYYRRKYGHRIGEFPVSEWLAAQTISLPVGPHLEGEDALYIGKTFKSAMASVCRH